MPTRARSLLRLAACLAATSLAAACSTRRTTPRAPAPAARVDPTSPDAPVQSAELLVGGARLCALTLVSGGRQVVCRPVADGERPRVWRSPALVAMSAVPGWQPPGARAQEQRDGTAMVVGVTTDGRAVRFDDDADDARDVALPPPGTHGRLVALHLHHTTARTLPGASSLRRRAWRAWVARTERGAVLVAHGDTPTRWDAAVASGARALSVDDDTLCVVLDDGALRCGPLQPPWRDQDDHNTVSLGPALQMPSASVTAFAPMSSTRCAVEGGSALRCVVPAVDDSGQVTVRGPARVASLAVGPSALCARDDRRAWWCAADLTQTTEGERSTREVSATPLALLAGVEDVAFDTSGAACARSDDGAVRCWRGQRPPRLTRIDVTGATDVAVTDAMGCALTPGGVACWPTPDGAAEATPRRAAPVTLGGPARAIAATGGRVCAALARDVVCWTGLDDLARPAPWGLARAGMQGEVREYFTRTVGDCVRTDRSEVWCRGAGAWVGRVRALEPRDYVDAADRACVILDDAGPHCWDAEQPTAPLTRLRSNAPRDALRTRCAATEHGRVRCRARDVAGIEGARVARGTAARGCAVTSAGGVVCWRANASEVGGAPTLEAFSR